MKNRFRFLAASLSFVLIMIGMGDISPGSKVKASSEVRAEWISYIDFEEAGLKDLSEASFRTKVNAIFGEAVDKNLNTVYVHARAFNDAIYPSENFAWSEYITSNKGGPGYDPLKIMVELAHRKGLRIEAWLNPYRISTSSARTSYVKSISTQAELSRMVEYSSNGQSCLVWNPADAEVRSLIAGEAGYIVKNYDVDGINFDDYFYAAAYYGSTTAAERRSYVNELVRTVYSEIKSIDSSVRFGISPAGNVIDCLDDGADVKTWLSGTGYIDYLIPQIYWSDSYGSGGTTTMFTNRLNEFLSINRNGTDIYVGLALYKAASKPSTSVDPGWTNSSSNLAEQVQYAESRGAKGFSLFSSMYLTHPAAQTELSNLIKAAGGAASTDNLAAEKQPTASSAFKNLSFATDGDIAAGSYADSFANTGLQWVQIDLGDHRGVSRIKLWHYFGDARKYHDVVVQLSNDPAFKTGVTTVYNNDANNSAGFGAGTDSEYAETSSGLNLEFGTVNARYARFYSNGSTVNSYSHYAEIEIYGNNLAAEKLPASSSSSFRDLSLATDGIIAAGNYADSGAAAGLQWIQADLGESCGVSNIKLWHYFGDARRYRDVVVQLSDDPAFESGVTTVYNNDTDNSAGLGTGTDSEYSETCAGKTISFSTVNARYVRFYSSGSSANGYSHYGEIQIFEAGSDDVIHPEAVTLSKTAAAMAAGETALLTASVLPENAADKAVAWSSSDTSVAKVTAGGLVTAVKAGTAVIKAATNDGGLEAACEVKVTEATPPGNLAAGKAVASSVPFTGAALITDGSRNTERHADSTPKTGLQWVQTDLGAACSLSSIRLWHYFGDGRKYHDVVVQVSNDPSFATGVTTVYNNDKDNSAGRGAGLDSEYAETAAGLSIKFAELNARYIRFYSAGSTANGYNHYVEIEAYNTENLAAGLLPATTAAVTNMKYATDGSKNTENYANVKGGVQFVQADLGASYDVSCIRLWHYFGDPRKYRDVVVQLSNDPTFATGVTTVYNNDTDNSAGRGKGEDSEYAETGAGKSIAFSAVKARYVRFYSNGSTANAWNHYVEIEIYGK